MHPRSLATQLFLVIGDSCNIIVVIKQVLLVWRKWNINRIVSETAFCTIMMVHNGTSSSYRLCLRSSWCYMYIYFFTRHLLVRAKGEVLVLLCVFFVHFFVNNFSTTRWPIQAKFCMRVYSGSRCVFSPSGVSGPRGRKKREMKFTLL